MALLPPFFPVCCCGETSNHQEFGARGMCENPTGGSAFRKKQDAIDRATEKYSMITWFQIVGARDRFCTIVTVQHSSQIKELWSQPGDNDDYRDMMIKGHCMSVGDFTLFVCYRLPRSNMSNSFPQLQHPNAFKANHQQDTKTVSIQVFMYDEIIFCSK